MTPNRRTIALTLAVVGLLVFSGQACPFLVAPLAPLDGNDAEVVVVEITLAPFIEPGVSTLLLVRAGIAQDDGTVDYSHTIDITLAITSGTTSRPFGVVDADGFFESEVTPNAGFELLTVFATATENLTLATATATATAQAIVGVPNLPITIESRDSGLAASALAEAGASGQQRHSPDQIRSDPDDYGTFNRELTATIAAQDPENFAGVANSTSTATHVSVLFTNGEGLLSGGAVRGTCTSSARISNEPQVILHGQTQASSGLDLRFTINGDKSYILTVNGTFTGSVGTSGVPTGQYRVGGNSVSSIVKFNPNEDGESLLVSDSVTLPPGGPYTLIIQHDCTAVNFGNTPSAETASSMDISFAFAPAE